ncbi:hypothetical protein HB364_08705 [Pseudoflavitalea sp. X16]|uniref:hypothetical protein n=1 Tax=Paraflavitalea devenefica TaxID=2716334 RepID=UPI001422A3C4|nr:hypothetical protein [Paraflavitalea devenefica]NII25157.1 hypothetical protein [Paraflavitalea devenefica]
MKYRIVVGHNSKALFCTDPANIKTSDELIRVFSALDNKFPQNEGYYISIQIFLHDSIHVDTEEFREKLKAGKAKGALLRLRNLRRKASTMAQAVYGRLEDGLL